MALVYLADDLKHRRKVALKVLKPELAAVIGADRFPVEITTTANPSSRVMVIQNLSAMVAKLRAGGQTAP